MVGGRDDSDLGDNAAGYRRNTVDIGRQVGLLDLAEEVEDCKAGPRHVGVVRMVNCALKPLEGV